MRIKTAIKTMSGLVKYKTIHQRTPITVSYLSTNQCNQKCKYCDWTKANQEQLSTARAIRLIEEIAKCGVQKLGFAGGESLHREDIAELLACAHSCGLIISVSTNGRNVPKHIDALKKYVDVVQISLDGPEEIHDMTRGKGSYRIVMDAIHLLKSNRIRMIANTVISRLNIKELQFVLDMARKYHYRTLFQPIFCYELSESKEVIQKLRPNYHEMHGAMDFLIQKKKEGMPIGNSVSFFQYVKDTWDQEQLVKCYANDLFCTIDPMGYVLPCCFDDKRLPAYNAAELGFRQAFQNCADNGFPKNCGGCYCNAYIETNLAFQLKADACLNGLTVI